LDVPPPPLPEGCFQSPEFGSCCKNKHSVKETLKTFNKQSVKVLQTGEKRRQQDVFLKYSAKNAWKSSVWKNFFRNAGLFRKNVRLTGFGHTLWVRRRRTVKNLTVAQQKGPENWVFLPVKPWLFPYEAPPGPAGLPDITQVVPDAGFVSRKDAKAQRPQSLICSMVWLRGEGGIFHF
jgi:hypothetical protein